VHDRPVSHSTTLSHGRDTFKSLSKIFCSTVSVKLRARLFHTLIVPTVLHDCESWTLPRAVCDKLNVFLMRCLRTTATSSVQLLGVYTVRSSDRPVGPTGVSDWSVRRSYRVNASSDRSERRSEESNMFDFVRLSKRVDTTSDWSDRPASRSTNQA